MTSTISFWKASIMLTVVGAVYSGVQFNRNLEQAALDVDAMKAQLASTKAQLELKKAEWDKVEALKTKTAQTLEQKDPLLKKKEEAENKFRALEGEFKYLVKSMRSSVDAARAKAAGQVFPEVRLTDGKILKEAKIRSVEERQISFMHSEGIGSVPIDLLPVEMRSRFDLGSDGLALELATVEQNIFSPGGEQEFEGLTLKSPFVLKKKASPPSVKTGGPILSANVYQYKSSEIEVNLASMKYGNEFPLQIDGAIDGAVQGMLRLEGISKPNQQVQDVKIEGAQAKRLSFSASRFDDTLYVEAVYILRGQQMWFVQTVFSEKTKNARPIANNLLSSLALKAAP